MPKKARPVATVNVKGNGGIALPPFPPLSPKKSLNCRNLLVDQIMIINNFFTPAECKLFVQFIDELPLELTPPKKRGEADRVSYRISVSSTTFAGDLFRVLQPHLPDFPYPASKARPGTSARPAHSLNSNIRMYKYTPSQHFGQHYDDAVKDTQAGTWSEWTLLIYLTGAEDGIVGGETVFYMNDKKTAVSAPLTRGTALLHRHGHECLLHEGSPVAKGTKYVLRSDVMFMD
ncbi:hypothetical protein K488DRAFT_46450 [Vararia minispora EC-137]|uniref:Uncharacterized protein n=1 Tax=Vararia minispora EC-137 TaxID=1314806 RepID=A0ACB8QQT3_9AGAM|nr:hypothetical protein K488DRAFT_46450 [Vararia minispora EC-137]